MSYPRHYIAAPQVDSMARDPQFNEDNIDRSLILQILLQLRAFYVVILMDLDALIYSLLTIKPPL